MLRYIVYRDDRRKQELLAVVWEESVNGCLLIKDNVNPYITSCISDSQVVREASQAEQERIISHFDHDITGRYPVPVYVNFQFERGDYVRSLDPEYLYVGDRYNYGRVSSSRINEFGNLPVNYIDFHSAYTKAAHLKKVSRREFWMVRVRCIPAIALCVAKRKFSQPYHCLCHKISLYFKN